MCPIILDMDLVCPNGKYLARIGRVQIKFLAFVELKFEILIRSNNIIFLFRTTYKSKRLSRRMMADNKLC